MKTGVAAGRNNADHNGKGKLKEDSFIRSKNRRRQHRTPPTSRRQGNTATHKTKQVWEEKGSDGITTECAQSKIYP